MTTLLESIGPAVWRASWQGAILALLIMCLLRVLGERLSPQWRYLLWSVVVARLLLVAAPAAPWSAFNLVPWTPVSGPPQTVVNRDHPGTALDPPGPDVPSPQADIEPGPETVPPPPAADSAGGSPARAPGATAVAPPIPAGTRPEPESFLTRALRAPFITRLLSSIWLAGCLAFGLQLAKTGVVLRRRLAGCRPVTDAATLKLLEAACLRIGRKQFPRLLVTPDSISPCIAGTWNPRIIVPEAIVTGSSTDTLRHVLAHELAHLMRGDLWTNWLLLTARIVHWFNPVAWWTIRAMQAEREAACDELALAALGEADRAEYAASIIDLATNLAPSAMAPAMIGLISSAWRLKARVERLVRAPSAARIRAPFAAASLLAIALAGLTDAMPATADPVQTQAKPPAKAVAVPSKDAASQATTVTLRGRCLDYTTKAGMAGVRVRLFKVEGRTAPIVEAAQAVTDEKGQFEFPDLVPPRPENPVDRLVYLIFADAPDRPIGYGGFWTMQEGDPLKMEIPILRDMTRVSGTVVNSRGQPVAGAKVAGWAIDGRALPSILAATTDADGRFEINRIPDFGKALGRSIDTSLTILHPDYPETNVNITDPAGIVRFALPDGCSVAGMVADAVTGKPAGGVEVVATDANGTAITAAATSPAGRFQMVLAEGRYNFGVLAKDRVCVALTNRECLAGEKVTLPPLKLIAGGFISGRVINTASGGPVVKGDGGGPVAIGLYGPSQPKGRVMSPLPLATVDAAGRFTLRAAPGDNFPYFVNVRGNRMAWDTLKQPPVVVKEGETTTYDMLITPEIPPAEKLAAARKLVDALPKQPSERTTRIILEFRKLDHTVDETELWCLLMRELVAMERDAVPQLCAELDLTTNDRMLRRLAFALRAINDPRAVPALIRALPKTLLPSSSDYGLLVEDQDLTAFMQKHDLNPGAGGTYFDFGRPVREVCGALKKLTGQLTDDAELFGIHLSEDPRRQVLKRRLFQQKAQRWQIWWETHWREFTNDAAYRKVNLKIVDEALPPPSTSLGPHARFGSDGAIGAILSPAIQEGEHASHFYDLDTGFQPKWPAKIPKDESRFDGQQLADWAVENGVDLMCITHRAEDGTETFVLRSFGMKVWEISSRDLRNLDKLLAAGKLPDGREVGELLMHYDPETQQLAPDADAAFLFVTRDGSLGLIETTDRVTQTANLNGLAGGAPRGVGFFKGVRFNLKSIVP
jgi:beta-lactamase regulating signal transducer with metallopeptidase domain/5-hydroxyisourate hydrolase-like protein (transthyretin family)